LHSPPFFRPDGSSVFLLSLFHFPLIILDGLVLSEQVDQLLYHPVLGVDNVAEGLRQFWFH
jgi:hypothetical protein